MFVVIWVLRERPWFAWSLAGDLLYYFEDEYGPSEALYEEMTYWAGDVG